MSNQGCVHRFELDAEHYLYIHGSPVARVTLGAASTALNRLHKNLEDNSGLKAKWEALGRATPDFLPRKLEGVVGAPELKGQAVVQQFLALRNRVAHPDPPPQWEEVPGQLQHLHAFFCACKAGGYYPDVLRYEGTYENRHGERFVDFLDERGRKRTVRTDVTILPRHHYYCFATNNPLHLHPTLIPKR
jgi:hypothetical protein